MLQSGKFRLEQFTAADGELVFQRWLEKLKDKKAAARIAARLQRLKEGNFGDCKPLGQGLWELRIDHGPGYRVYYSILGDTIILLLCGGDKRKQQADIGRAALYLKEYKRMDQ